MSFSPCSSFSCSAFRAPVAGCCGCFRVLRLMALSAGAPVDLSSLYCQVLFQFGRGASSACSGPAIRSFPALWRLGPNEPLVWASRAPCLGLQSASFGPSEGLWTAFLEARFLVVAFFRLRYLLLTLPRMLPSGRSRFTMTAANTAMSSVFTASAPAVGSHALLAEMAAKSATASTT